MPELIPTNLFLKDVEPLKSNRTLWKKVTKALGFLEENPWHPGLHVERIINDPTAWCVRVDKRFRISVEPRKHHTSGNPDWSGGILLLRILDHDDLYKKPR